MPTMPRLSESLTGPRRLDACQSCGAQYLDLGETDLQRWMEHDDQDRPAPIVVVLCKKCSGRLIEPHPRLYHEICQYEPMPGAMALCEKCKHREGLRCRNPQAQINGGPGLEMKFPQPDRVHLCRGKNSGWMTIWKGPVTECNGRDVVPKDWSVVNA